MSDSNRTAELARLWIQAWKDMDLERLRENLAEDFVHTSPFGRLEGRDDYLATVAPMARKSVAELTIKKVVASGDHAVIWFENRTHRGAVDTCDWVRVENDQIQEIRSFYDSAVVREILSPDEQDRLDDSE